MKTRKIIVSKDRVYEDIDNRTMKLSDIALEGNTADSVASDTKEYLDGDILSRYVAMRDAMLRTKLAFALVQSEVAVADDSLENSTSFEYELELEDSFLDSNLKMGAILIHEYLVHGTIYDWLAKNGLQMSLPFATEMDNLEGSITTLFRGSSLIKSVPRLVKNFGRRR